MKKILWMLLISAAFFKAEAQTERVPGPVERQLTDSICNCVVKMDMSAITTKAEATAAYTDCVMKHANLLPALAEERNVELGDKKAMEGVGIDIALNLIKQDCKGFKNLALIMGKDSADSEGISSMSGTLKRIENKGFNYFVIAGADHKETSFIWLRQFPGSEKFMNGATNYAGKNVKIKYQEMEVYLPQAKGYYKVKEIVSLEVK